MAWWLRALVALPDAREGGGKKEGKNKSRARAGGG